FRVEASSHAYASDFRSGRDIPFNPIPPKVQAVDPGPVGADRDRAESAFRRLDCLPAPAGSDVPDLQPMVLIATGDQPITAGTKGQGSHDAGMRQSRAWLAGQRVPQAHRVVPASRSNPAAVR